MALVVLLRGVNVGGHRTFRPAALVKKLANLDAVNIGAAGTFVIRRPIARAKLRAELARGLPFETEIVICEGRDLLALTARNPFAGQPAPADVVHFVSVLAGRPRAEPPLPLSIPPSGQWMMKILERDNAFVVGMYRRNMKAVGNLGKIDRLFGVPATTRNWNTITAIAKVLSDGAAR
ncbi:MAG TPA: DUF1697 domain-containing protein [Vicinamibacterales bacterium]|nr:DUF1697 domain-containing protein [Vicinamibacterales bacterium]